MNWYKKEIRRKFYFAYGSHDGEEFSTVLKQAAPGSIIAETVDSKEIKRIEADALTNVICIDAESAITLSSIANKICIFWLSPYLKASTGARTRKGRGERYLQLHNSLCRSKKIIALTNQCREDIQLFHSQFIHQLTLPGTTVPSSKSVKNEKIAIRCTTELTSKHLAVMNQLGVHDPVFLSEESQLSTSSMLGIRTSFLSDGLFSSVNSRVLVWFGYEDSTHIPLRIMDCPKNECVVIQVLFQGLQPKDNQRGLGGDCIGRFELGINIEHGAREIAQFVDLLMNDEMMFSSVLSAQRRYLSAQHKFHETLTKELFA